MEREAAAYDDAAMMEEGSPSRSRCSSGCQSGWTLYLDHSDVCIHLEPGQRWMVPQGEPAEDEEYDDDDSMVSDASSGPSPRLRDGDDDEALRRGREPQRHFCGHRCWTSSSGVRGSACASVDRSYESSSSWSRSSLGHQLGRQPVVVRARDGGEDDDLDDTASSSAVLRSPMGAMVYIAPAESMSSARYTMPHMCVTS